MQIKTTKAPDFNSFALVYCTRQLSQDAIQRQLHIVFEQMRLPFS